MNFSYIKLNAKKKLVRNYLKSFVMSALPYVSIFTLFGLNYYFYIFLRNADFSFVTAISYYEIYLKATLLTITAYISFLLWRIIQLYSDKYFYSKNMKTHIKLKFSMCMTAISVSILKFFISVAWSAFYLLPCAVVGATLYYSVISNEYSFNVMLTLFVSAIILFFIGVSFLYVTLKRYSMCNFVIFSRAETDSIKVLAKSVELIEKNTIRYSFYRLSLLGWIFSCILIVPIFYVLPYIKMARYSFYKAITRPYSYKSGEIKPTIFYVTKKEKA